MFISCIYCLPLTQVAGWFAWKPTVMCIWKVLREGLQSTVWFSVNLLRVGASHRDSWIITWHQRHVWFWSSTPITGRLISLCRTDESATQTKHPFTSSVGCLHGQPGAYSVSHANVKCILPAYSAAVLAVICELLSQGHKAALWVNWSESAWTQFAVPRGLFFCLCVCEGEQTDVFIHNKCRSLYRPGEHLPEMFPQVSGLLTDIIAHCMHMWTVSFC